MSSRQKSVLLFILLFLSFTLYFQNIERKEEVIKGLKVGMTKVEVERLVGKGEQSFMATVCEKCPVNKLQLIYNGNPSLLHGRLEDNLVICYVEDKVCGFTRYGL